MSHDTPVKLIAIHRVYVPEVTNPASRLTKDERLKVLRAAAVEYELRPSPNFNDSSNIFSGPHVFGVCTKNRVLVQDDLDYGPDFAGEQFLPWPGHFLVAEAE